MNRLATLTLLALAGCGAAAPAPNRVLVRVDAIAAGSRCANGGNAVHSGIDKNGDGILEDSEVSAVDYLCNAAPDPMAPILERTDTVGPQKPCSSGGTVVSVGPDTNGNGMLDDDEIVKSTTVCNTPPAAVLVRTRVEPAGATCANGGTDVDSGADENGDGTLEDGEVTKTSAICNPADKAALVRLDPEPKGANCGQGGTAIKSGLDLDGDGKLEDSEVTATHYACNPPLVIDTLHGNRTISTQADVDAFAGIQRLAGSLTITNAQPTTINLGDLQDIDGSLTITNNATLTTLTIVGVSTFGDVTISDNAQLNNLELGLEQLGGITVHNVTVSNNAALQSIDGVAIAIFTGSLTLTNNATLGGIDAFGTMTTIPGDVTIAGNAGLVNLPLSSVTSIGGALYIHDNDGLLDLTGNKIATVGSLVIHGNAKLNALDLDVKDIAGDLVIDSTVQLPNPSLQSLRHVGGSFIIENNVGLRDLGGLWNLLAVDQDLTIVNNPALGSLVGLSSVASLGGTLMVKNNAKLIDVMLGVEMPFDHGGDVIIETNPLLETISLSVTTSLRQLSVIGNPQLTTLWMGQLAETVWGIVVEDNPLLPECQVDALATRVKVTPQVSGNNTQATCN